MSFLKEALCENGAPSSKRLFLFITLTLFIFIDLVNLFTGKKPADVYDQNLFYMVQVGIGVVFGSNILDTIAKIQITKSNNNAKVGAPSIPQPVADPAPTTTNVINK